MLYEGVLLKHSYDRQEFTVALIVKTSLFTLLPRNQVHTLIYKTAHFCKWLAGFVYQVHAPNYAGISACTNIRSTYMSNYHQTLRS